jgi:hypothetical protein
MLVVRLHWICRCDLVGIIFLLVGDYFAWSLAARDRCCGLEIRGDYLMGVAYLVHHIIIRTGSRKYSLPSIYCVNYSS